MLRAIRARELGLSSNFSTGHHLQSLVETATHANDAASLSPPSPNPQYAVAFSPTLLNGNLLVAASEEGIVTLWDTRRSLSQSRTLANDPHSSLRSSPASIAEHIAHENAIFDICWIPESASYVTASGDTTLKVFQAESTNPVAHLRGHSGSVKCVRAHESNCNVLASSSRDGSICIWDLRDNASAPVAAIHDAHRRPLPRQQLSASARKRRNPSHHSTPLSTSHASSNSATALSFIPGISHTLLSGGTDGCLKMWDLRVLSPPPAPKSTNESVPMLSLPAATTPGSDSLDSGRYRFGITSIDVNSFGDKVLVSTTDSRIYMYSIPHLGDPVPSTVLTGHHCQSFYVKAVFSPDSRYALSGSGDSNAYIWDIHAPSPPNTTRTPLLRLPAACVGDVSAVHWSCRDPHKIATGGDDGVIRVWQVDRACGRWPGYQSGRRGACEPVVKPVEHGGNAPIDGIQPDLPAPKRNRSGTFSRSAARLGSSRPPLRNSQITDFLR